MTNAANVFANVEKLQAEIERLTFLLDVFLESWEAGESPPNGAIDAAREATKPTPQRKTG
jgi:hypothetical protein